ncbi:hypothetical protein NPIL_168561 [Nephila pilipes]|uniref:Uncharacterized protein n=1 Tax=Nephila pilipes TaxID=299642 RepID=A0A8X6PL43_NEPPI|nr:hypothetical protein NPIL_168561 [Nephila pilipes]
MVDSIEVHCLSKNTWIEIDPLDNPTMESGRTLRTDGLRPAFGHHDRSERPYEDYSSGEKRGDHKSVRARI